jgi:hypothetical protein
LWRFFALDAKKVDGRYEIHREEVVRKFLKESLDYIGFFNCAAKRNFIALQKRIRLVCKTKVLRRWSGMPRQVVILRPAFGRRTSA